MARFGRRWRLAVLPALGLLSGSPAAADGSFTIAVIGDQQVPVNNTTYYPSFTVQTDWIAANAAATNLRFVTQVGDIIEHGNNLLQWDRAEAAMVVLDSATNAGGGTGVPWNVAYGNHEVNWSAPGDDPAGADADNYRQYFGSASGTHRYASQPEFGGVSSNDLNTWHIIKSSDAVDAREYLMLNLEYDVPGHAPGSTPDPADIPAFDAIAWAWEILGQHPGMPTIVTTHVFQGTRFGPPNNPYTPGPGRNSQIRIFDKLVKDHPQIFMVLSGHTSQDTHQVKLNANGLPVLQMVTDYNKVRANGGNGYMRLVEIDEGASEIRVRTYTPGIPSYNPPTPAGYDASANGEFTVAMDWATRFPAPSGPIMGAPAVSGVSDDGATVQCRLINEDAADVTLVWAFADQGAMTVGDWTSAAGGGSHSFGAATVDEVLSHVLSGLTGDRAYSFRFLASAGVESDWSSAGSFTTGLGGLAAPSGFAGVAGTTPGGTKIDLSWADGYSTETGFVVRRSTDAGFGSYDEFTVGGDETTYTDKTTEPNTTYFYRIAAVGSTGNGPFTGDLEVATGDAGAGPVAGLFGHWKMDGGTAGIAGPANLVDSSGNGHDLPADSRFSQGSYAAGISDTGISSPRYQAAEALSRTLAFEGGSKVSLSAWIYLKDDNGGNDLIGSQCIAGYPGTGETVDQYALTTGNGSIIWKYNSNGSAGTATASFTPSVEGGWYHVVGVYESGVGGRIHVNGPGLGAGVTAMGGSVGTLADNKISAGARFAIGTYANSTGYTSSKIIDDVQVYGEALTAEDVAFLYGNPGSPLLGDSSALLFGAPEAAAVTDDGATVSCQLLNADADSVTLVWSRSDQGTGSVSDWTSAPGGGSHAFGAAVKDQVLSRILTGLDGDTPYSFRFYATAGGESAWSVEGRFSTGLAGGPAPTGLLATAGTTATTTKVDLSWSDDFATETGFLIQRSTDAGFPTVDEFAADANATTSTDATTAPNTTYFYRIAAVGTTGSGPFSAGVEVTTGSNPGGGPVASLVAHWKLDEVSGTTAADSSGNGLDISGGGTYGVAGVAGTAISAPRLLSDPADEPTLNLAGGSVTLSLWAQGGSTPNSWRGLAGIEGSSTSSNDAYSLKLTNTDLINWTFVGASPLASPDTFNNYAAANGGWAHIVGTYDGTTGVAVLYVNGEQVATTTNMAGIPDRSVNFGIGRYNNTTSFAFDKAIDDVQLYDTALSATDVGFLYANPGIPLGAVISDPFGTWAATHITNIDPDADASFDGNPDGDSFANGLEWALGGDPLGFDSLSDLLGVDGDATTGLTFTFNREDAAEGEVVLAVEFSHDLFDGDLHISIVPASSSTVGGVIYTIAENGSAPDSVTATVPAVNAAGGKLFGRLSALQE